MGRDLLRRVLAVAVVVNFVGAGALPRSVAASESAIARTPEFIERVDGALERGVAWLTSQQRQDGSFRTEQKGYPGGGTALAYLALRSCGVARDDPRAVRAYRALRERYVHSRGGVHQRTYASALTMMAIEAHGVRSGHGRSAAGAEEGAPTPHTRLEEEDAIWMSELVACMAGTQAPEGAWGYGTGRWRYGRVGGSYMGGRRDLSNTQYALLGLHAATLCGVDVERTVYENALHFLLAAQQGSALAEPRGRGGDRGRGWGYQTLEKMAPGHPQWNGFGGARGSMTAGAVGAVVICRSALLDLDDDAARSLRAAQLDHDAKRSLRDGVAWLGEHFTVERNPGVGGWQLYYLYAVERAGVLAGVERMGDHDWYGEGAEYLVRTQMEAGEWLQDTDPFVSTCFALLFLSRATVPVERGDITPSGAVEGVDFETARQLRGRDLVDFVDLVISRWTRVSDDADRAALRRGIASVGPAVVLPLLRRMGAGNVRQRGPAHEVLRSITGLSLAFDPAAGPAARSEALIPWELWIMETLDRLEFQPDTGTLAPPR